MVRWPLWACQAHLGGAAKSVVPLLDSSLQATYSPQRGTLDLWSTLSLIWPSGPGCNSRSRRSHGETITATSSEPVGHMHLQVSNPNIVHQHCIPCTRKKFPVHGDACSIPECTGERTPAHWIAASLYIPQYYRQRSLQHWSGFSPLLTAFRVAHKCKPPNT